nr:immunoglobulin light chain junction region [Macaca mulatta]MOX45133.1 immunoglobulin light chain junction region [Macaca mulatta]MOX47014.1 immunoglobulin light chain junction region [Macaca mulatta]
DYYCTSYGGSNTLF